MSDCEDEITELTDELDSANVLISNLEDTVEELNETIEKFWNPKWGTRNPKSYDPVQLAHGIRVEMEHTKTKLLAQEIAMDHLDEFKNYYVFLELMEDLLKLDVTAGYIRQVVSEDIERRRLGLKRRKGSHYKPRYVR